MTLEFIRMSYKKPCVRLPNPQIKKSRSLPAFFNHLYLEGILNPFLEI